MKIRKIKESDLAGLALLYRGFWNEESSIPRMKSVWRKIKDNPNYLILNAVDGGEIIGTVLSVICEELYGACNPFAVVEDLIVAEACRRQGIGSALMRELERRLIKRNCSQIILVTEANRSDAQRFYESLGFTKGTHRGYKKPLRIKV
jgi:ribosomal protein S18 acetylase RimI-like enzyme